jgi:hypothetical protein
VDCPSGTIGGTKNIKIKQEVWGFRKFAGFTNGLVAQGSHASYHQEHQDDEGSEVH